MFVTETEHTRHVISVLVGDRVGILRDLTRALDGAGAAIEAISQTVVEGYFTVILVAAFPGRDSSDDVRRMLLGSFAPDEASILVRPYRPAKRRSPVAGERYILTITGPDRPDVLSMATAFLAERGINIEDWSVGAGGKTATHIGEITVPLPLDIKQIQDEFRALLARHGLVSGFQHENIFRATNEVCPMNALLAEPARA
jgi:glycine cleavage system transcriptional repressor